MEAITEVYESGWSGHDLLYVQAQNMEMLWQDFSHKLGDQVLIPLNTYTNQFPEVRVSYHQVIILTVNLIRSSNHKAGGLCKYVEDST